VHETERLLLRPLTPEDAPFILELVNEPDWIRHIGDRKVRTIEDAERYLRGGPMAMFEKHGFSLLAVILKETGAPVGMCGLIKRPELDDIDLGYALLNRFTGQGLALEAARKVLEDARDERKFSRLIAIVSPENLASIRLLEKLGLNQAGYVSIDPVEEELLLYTIDF
jgi:ribosomal-protein-alanine N-acetyltransferase